MINYEGLLWKKIRSMVGNRWWAVRIESHMTVGIPDVLFAINGRSGWIELKSVEKMDHIAATITLKTLTDAQIAWLHNGNAWMIVEIRSTGSILLFNGRYVIDQTIETFRASAITKDTIGWVLLEMRGE